MTVAYLVLDQNVLRKPELDEKINRQPDLRFVLPDLALLEMTKGEQWEATLLRSLSTLASVPDRTFLAYSVNEALAYELRTQRPKVDRMLWKPATTFTRDLLKWVRTGRETEAISRIRRDPSEDKQAVIADHLTHEENKASIARLIAATKSQITSETQKALRGKKFSPEEVLDIVHQLAQSVAYGVLEDRNVLGKTAQTFLRQRPVFYRYVIVHAWNCIHWISQGGFETFADASASNELLDHQYVITASCFQGILSNETKVNNAYQALIAVLPREV